LWSGFTTCSSGAAFSLFASFAFVTFFALFASVTFCRCAGRSSHSSLADFSFKPLRAAKTDSDWPLSILLGSVDGEGGDVDEEIPVDSGICLWRTATIEDGVDGIAFSAGY
jgi:hypothetical protein